MNNKLLRLKSIILKNVNKYLFTRLFLKDIIPFSNHPVFRVLLGWLMPPKISLLKLTQTDIIKRIYKKKHFMDDYIVPLSSLAETIKFATKSINVRFRFTLNNIYF